MKVSVVVPVYNSEKSLEELHARIKSVFENEIKQDYELVLVDDFSKDKAFEVMEKLAEQDENVVAIQLAKNCGQHAALLCGFECATGDFVVTMDDDLQHPPEEIPKLLNEILARDDLDVVIGKYDSKKHSLIRNLGTKVSGYVSYKVYSKPKDIELTSFRIMRKNVVDDLLKFSVNRPRVGNMLLQVTGRIGNVTVEHDARKYGKSGYTFSHLVKDLVSNLVTNSSFPLLVVRDLGIGSFILSILLALYFFLKYLFKGISIPGWTSSVLIMLFYNGIILFAIGIIGDYLMRIISESQKLPNYFIRKIVKKNDDEEKE